MKKINIIAGIMLLVMFGLLFASMRNDSATMDELAHIPAGYGYISQLDFRLNPEHPPLLKALAGLSARIFVNPYFPTNTSYWQTSINGQWDQGRAFLYESGNDADQIIFWARMPFLLLAMLFGWMLFMWTRRRFGPLPALLTIALYAFSPTFLAHARYVTTDLGAAFGFFIGVTTFLAFLEAPSKRNIAIAGIALGVALLIKFSLVLLAPIYAIMFFLWIATRPGLRFSERTRSGIRLLGKSVVIAIVAFFLVWGTYALFTARYPQAKQMQDTKEILGSFPAHTLANFDRALVGHPATRSLGHYLLGLLMVTQRASGGNTGFFLGEVSASGSRWYFPLLYLLKEPLALHILTLIAMGFAIQKTFFSHLVFGWKRMRGWIAGHFAETSALAMIGVYWGSSISSPLNIGVRHVLPTFPFIYILVSRQIAEWLHTPRVANPTTWGAWLREVYHLYIKTIPRYVIAGALFLWIVIGALAVYPYFLSSYNELAGGIDNGHLIATDSNYDWGQDLKRLRDFVEERGITTIAFDYFGGGNPQYYLGNRSEPWWSAKGPPHGWFAISATFRQGAFGTPTPGFNRKPEDSYPWLRAYEPIARAGKSIFIYKLP